MSNTNNNPLKQFYRVERSSVKLPSRGKFYSNGIIEINDDGEVAIYPMTAADEMQLRNPDALLTGAAISDVLKSCVPSLKEPKKLLSCDIDALMIGVRHASYGDDASMTVKCPKCKEENEFALNLEIMLNSTEVLEDEYEVVLHGGDVTVFVKPGTFASLMKRQRSAFEGAQVQKILLDPDLSEERRIKAFAQTFKKLSKITFDLIVDSVHKIVFTDKEGELQEVTNKQHIDEFIRNISKGEVDKIEEKITEVNSVGIQKTMEVVCLSCENKWETPIEFNPVNFS
jgi:hypothetical protein